MYDAVFIGDLEMVELMLKHRKTRATLPSEWGTPLMLAAKENRLSVFRRLIEAGAGVDERSLRGETALMSAAFAGAKEAFFSAYAFGADLKARDRRGSSVLHYAAVGPELSRVVNEWRGLASRQTGTANRIPHFLLTKGFDPNDRDIRGETPLHYIARNDLPQFIALLVENGGNPLLTNHIGESACSIAASKGATSLTLAEFLRVGVCSGALN